MGLHRVPGSTHCRVEGRLAPAARDQCRRKAVVANFGEHGLWRIDLCHSGELDGGAFLRHDLDGRACPHLAGAQRDAQSFSCGERSTRGAAEVASAQNEIRSTPRSSPLEGSTVCIASYNRALGTSHA